MEALKGLILSGGKGTRLRPITHTSAKQLVPVANKPVLFYGIEAMAAAGIEEVGIIIAPETGDEISAPPATARASACGSPTSSQDEPLGLAHAVLTAEPFLGDEPVRDVPRRQPAPGRDHRARRRVPRARARRADPAHAGARPRELRRRRAGDGATGQAGLVRGSSRSRPSRRPTSRSSASTCSRPAIHDAARAIEPSARGELEITDAIQHLVDAGHARRAAHRARLVEGHRPARRHARGQPPDPRQPRRSGSTASWSTRRSTGASSSRRARGSSARTVRGPAIIGAGARAARLLRRPLHRDRRGLHDRPTPRSSTRSCSRAAPSATSTAAWSPRCSGAT